MGSNILVVESYDFDSLRWNNGRLLTTVEKEKAALISSFYVKHGYDPIEKTIRLFWTVSSRTLKKITDDYRKYLDLLIKSKYLKNSIILESF